jgi:glycosyltransferase involved in cell wall biosynthesis
MAPLKIFYTLKKINADVYIVSPAGAEVGIAAFFCKIKKKKLIVRTASSMECDGDFIRRKKIIGKIYYYGLNNANAVIAQSENNRKLLKDSHGIDAVLIRNAFFMNKAISKHKSDYVLWVGKMETNKKPDLFLDIARKISNINFVMISPRRNYQEDFAERMMLEAKKISNLTFIEKVPYNEIQEYFDRAKLFVCTSDYEGFPNVHLQACLGKTPIVTLNINPDDYLDNYDIGYCAGGNVDNLVEKIEELMSNSDKLEKKASNAYEYVYKNHNVEFVGEYWKSLIGRIIA